MKFTKRPIEIDAWMCKDLLRSASNVWDALPKCIVDKYGAGELYFGSDHIMIKTLEGEMRAERDDMIIQGVKGEIYPCKPDIFKATYFADEL